MQVNKKGIGLLIFSLFFCYLIVGCCLGSNIAPPNCLPSDKSGVMITSSPPELPGESKIFSELMVTFIDVGQGDCSYVMLPNGENILIDAGDNH